MITINSPVLMPEVPGLIARMVKQMNDMQARIDDLEDWMSQGQKVPVPDKKQDSGP